MELIPAVPRETLVQCRAKERIPERKPGAALFQEAHLQRTI
jgi:hypothetical protein